jgi:hypothetical protein
MVSAADAYRLSIEMHEDGGLWLSVDLQRLTRVLAQARQPVANSATGFSDQRVEFFDAERLSVGFQLGATGSLGILAQAMAAATAREFLTW